MAASHKYKPKNMVGMLLATSEDVTRLRQAVHAVCAVDPFTHRKKEDPCVYPVPIKVNGGAHPVDVDPVNSGQESQNHSN
jgi:hypothetical protein